MANINALLMSDTEVLVTLVICAAAGVMIVGMPDVARGSRASVKIALGACLAMAAAAGLAWSSIPAPHIAASVVTLAGG